MSYGLVRRAALIAPGLIASCLATPAMAYEDRIDLGVEAGYAARLAAPEHGFVAGLDVGFGLGDAWTLRLDAAYGFHPDTLHRVRGAAELLYVVDILQVVPYAGLGVGALVSVPPTDARADLEVHAVLGLDVLVDREVVIGIAIRPVLVPTWFEADPFHLAVTARAAVLLDR
jgi:hypothetical protein